MKKLFIGMALLLPLVMLPSCQMLRGGVNEEQQTEVSEDDVSVDTWVVVERTGVTTGTLPTEMGKDAVKLAQKSGFVDPVIVRFGDVNEGEAIVRLNEQMLNDMNTSETVNGVIATAASFLPGPWGLIGTLVGSALLAFPRPRKRLIKVAKKLGEAGVDLTKVVGLLHSSEATAKVVEEEENTLS